MVQSAKWAKPLYNYFRFKVLFGGRGGGKTTEVASMIVDRCTKEKLRICCGRDFDNATDESQKVALAKQIEARGWEQYFDIKEDSIDCLVTGSHIFFKGLARNINAKRSMEGVNILWIEEGQYIDTATWEIIEPTIREPKSEIIITFNPTFSTDIVWKWFCAQTPPPNTFLQKVNYTDNPFVTQEILDSAAHCLAVTPERYPHIWLGELDDAADDQRRILPINYLDACHQTVPYNYMREPKRAGFDVADEGDDMSSLAIRQGPVVLHLATFGSNIQTSCEYVYDACKEYGVDDLWFDTTGMGIGVRDRFKGKMPCKNVVGVHFGGKVKGKHRRFDERRKNAEVFDRINAQLGWNMHMRAENAHRNLINPKLELDPRTCLYFMEGTMPAEHRAKLAQPIWLTNKQGRMVVEKKPKGYSGSPDVYDALGLSFAHDVRHGLKVGGRHILRTDEAPPEFDE